MFSRESAKLKHFLSLWYTEVKFRPTRLDPGLMKLIGLISIADTDRPFLRQHDEVVIGEDAKDWIESKLRP